MAKKRYRRSSSDDSGSDSGGEGNSRSRSSRDSRDRDGNSEGGSRSRSSRDSRDRDGNSEGGSRSRSSRDSRDRDGDRDNRDRDSNDGGGSSRSRSSRDSRDRDDGGGNSGGNSRSRGSRDGGGNGGGSGRSRRGGGGGGNRRRRNSNSNRGGGGGGNKNGNFRRRDRNREPVEIDDSELFESFGLLELHPNGYGFLRNPENNYSRDRSDPFVPGTMIEKYGLREGLILRGKVQPGRRQQGPRLREVIDVDGMSPDDYSENVKRFEQLTPINPENWYQLENGPKPLTTRVMDLLTPLGKGQRALIVAPPRSGKTMMLQHISQGIAANHPDSVLMVLLVDERPEEVTDMRRNVLGGEVIASSLDEDIESHVRLSQLVVERCKRLAEMGRDVFLLMDSITRLARAFNKWVSGSSRRSQTMSGGIDAKAMDIPKKLFSSARAFEEGGSLTIVGTALIDTGSRMDELIFQEFKGTGNMELVLSRDLADMRIWPAIDIAKSGTRREELLLSEEKLNAIVGLRRSLLSMNDASHAMRELTKHLSRFDSNDMFIEKIAKQMESI